MSDESLREDLGSARSLHDGRSAPEIEGNSHLMVTLRKGEYVQFGGPVHRVYLANVRLDRISLGIYAPRSTRIRRQTHVERDEREDSRDASNVD